MTRVLVTDAEQRSALAVVRSLGRAGFTVFTCSHRPRSLAGASRWSAGSSVVPDPLADPQGFTDGVASTTRKRAADVLLPITEAALRALLPHRERFPGVVIPFPSAEVFALASDKERLLNEASSVGIAVPRQVVVRHAACLDGPEVGPFYFPAAVKAARSVVLDSSGRGIKTAARYARDMMDLRQILHRTADAEFPVLVQERLEGRGIGVFLLMWNGKVLARFTHERIREKPPTGGVSAYCRSIPSSEALLSRSVALLERLGWCGVAMLEYKFDRHGTPFLMEVNGRFWGSLQLAVDCGVDFPSLLVRAALGRPVAPVESYRSGVYLRWFWGDVDHLLARLLRPAGPNVGVPGSRLRAVSDFVRGLRPGVRDSVFRFSDIRPFLIESFAWLMGEAM